MMMVAAPAPVMAAMLPVHLEGRRGWRIDARLGLGQRQKVAKKERHQH